MFQPTLALLKSRLRSLRPAEKQKRNSTAPTHSPRSTQAENGPTVAPISVISPSPTIDAQPEIRYERKMGDSELSYYLQSRATGVNDVCALPLPRLHCGRFELTFFPLDISSSVSTRQTMP